MSHYRKALVAALGLGAQALTLAATAADSGLLPEAWRPWGVVVVALATALGVYRVPNAAPQLLDHPGRHEA